jgi:HK97 family phage portal protein
MSLLDRFLVYLGDRARHRQHRRTAALCDDPRVAFEVCRYLDHHPAESVVTLDTPRGKGTFDRGDVPRLQAVYKRASVGERVFARAMMGGSAYGFPGGWSQDRIEQVQHFKTWVHIAVRSIWQRIARLKPNVAFVTDECRTPGQQLKGYHPDALDYRCRKSLHAVQPHEHLTPAGSGHPLVRLFNNPNGPDVAFDLWYELGLFLELTGNSYLWAVPSNLGVLDGTLKACELWVLPSHWVWPRVGKNQLVEYYEVRPWVGPGMLRFPPEDLIHVRFKSPIHKVDGWSPMTAGSEWIDTGESVNRARFFQMKNGCFVTGNLQLDERYHDPDDEELERIYTKFFARFQGEHQAGKPIITPPGAKYVPLQIAPAEMAYTESADQLRDWVLALWGVPKEVAGIQDAGSEIAMYGPLRQFAENCLIPRLTYLGQILTEKLAHRWDRRLRVWWDDPTPDDPEQKRADMKLLYEAQATTPDEIRSHYGLPPLPDGSGGKINSPHPPAGQTNIHTGGAPAVGHAPPAPPPAAAAPGPPAPKPSSNGNGRLRPAKRF